MLKTRRASLFLALSATIGLSQAAHAEHCSWRFEQAFSLLDARDLRKVDRGARSPLELRAAAELEVDVVFGPPVAQCEEGGYTLFLDRFERFATKSLRMKGPERDTRLRIASAIIRRSPDVVDYVQQSKEVTRFDQMLSNLGAIAQEVGVTPEISQLIDAIKAEGMPKAKRRENSTPPDPHVTKVHIPTLPLPAWAVISVYEIQDHAQRKEHEKIQGKVEAIINWMKSVTPPNVQP